MENKNRGRMKKNPVSIEETIRVQEETVAKAKAKYDAEVAKLKDLLAKRDEMKKKELLEAVQKSNKSFEEIMKFLTSEE